MILFLPPAPKTGDFFKTIRKSLRDVKTEAATYPGYGGIEALPRPTIGAYAKHLLPNAQGGSIVGFHTGCLVAIEMALQSRDVGALVLVDIPYFNLKTRQNHNAGLDPKNPEHDAFRAAFSYDLESALANLSHPVTCIATGSPLYDPTIKAAQEIDNSVVIERRDIVKPVFESDAMAALIRALCI